MSEADVMRKLDAIQKDLNELKERVIDADTLLTEDDINALKHAQEDLKDGRTTTLS